MDEKSENGTISFLRTILISLCANFYENDLYSTDWNCQFKSDYFYRLRSLKGKTLKITTLQKLPLSGVEVDESGNLLGNGIVFDLIHELQDKIGFYINITLPKKNVIGNENEGIIQMLKNKEVDMAVAFIPMMHVFKNIVSYSTTLANFEWVLLMARPTASSSGSGLLAPFQQTVWFFILISLIIAGPTMYLIVYFRTKFTTDRNHAVKPYTLGSCVWFVYGALMKQGSTLSPHYDSARLFFATWWIFITILTSFYTANLTAFLTLSQLTLAIETTKDIYEHHRYWMAEKGGYEESMINNDNSFEYLKETIPTYGRFTSEPLEQILQKVLHGEIFIAEKRHAEKILITDYLNKTRNHVKEKDRCTYVLTPKPILSKSVAFAYQKGSKLQPILDPILLSFVSGGIVTHLLKSSLPLTSVCPLNLPNTERKLLNSDLATTYFVVFVGFAIALIVFLGEVIFRCCSKKSKKTEDAFNKGFYKSKINSLSDLISKNEIKSKSELHDDFILREYYREIVPYNYYKKDAITERNIFGFNLSNMKSKNVVFQYTN